MVISRKNGEETLKLFIELGNDQKKAENDQKKEGNDQKKVDGKTQKSSGTASTDDYDWSYFKQFREGVVDYSYLESWMVRT